MTNKEFDQWLKESLSSVRPEPTPQDWDHFVHQVEESESAFDSGFDDAIKNAMTQVTSTSVPDWQRMEQQLDADEHQFDQHVRQSIEQFEVPYNPHTWPTLHAKLSEDERLRRRLIIVKVLEIAAVFIVFLTFYNFFPALKSSVIEPAENLIRKELRNKEDVEYDMTEETRVGNTGIPDASVLSKKSSEIVSSEAMQRPEEKQNPVASASGLYGSAVRAGHNGHGLESVTLSTQNTDAIIPESLSPVEILPVEIAKAEIVDSRSEDITEPATLDALSTLSTPQPTLSFVGPMPVFHSLLSFTPEVTKMSKVRFGMMAIADVNTLFFPEEHFYSQGRSIHFSEKEIVAGGYSAGASLLFDFKRIMIETGLTYSSKTFGPDRNLFIGTSADRHSLDFENITLNIVSLPLYLHWKLDGRGVWRVYATGGASMHVIANANYDLIAENIYTSSAVQSGQQLQNIREVQRVREHMRDGAKFSSKGYLTAMGGFGVERYLNSRMSVFAQPMYQYQIPFFGLIDQNGKHLQNGSLLLGTRISL